MIISLVGSIMPNFAYLRQKTMVCADKVVYISNIVGTIENIKGHKELPVFAGIPSEKFKDHSFSTIAIDYQTMRDGKAADEVYIGDFLSAKHQILNKEDVQDFGFDELVGPISGEK